MCFKTFIYSFKNFIKYNNINFIPQDIIPEAVNSLPSNRKTKPPCRSVSFSFWDLPCPAWEAVGASMNFIGGGEKK